MTAWTSKELASIGNAEELLLSSRRRDCTFGPFVTIWVVRVGDDLFIRSVNGRSGTWFRSALAVAEGRIRAGGVRRDVTLEEASAKVRAPVTAAYHEKYDRYGPSIVGTVVSAKAVTTTLRLVPR